MKTSSAKAKGRKLQNLLVKKLIDMLGIDPEDVESRPMGSQGEDIIISKNARKDFPFSPECKNQEKINIWDSFAQAEANTPPNVEPLLVFTRNRKPVYAMLELDTLLTLLAEFNEAKKESGTTSVGFPYLP
jgi:hypothetical protein